MENINAQQERIAHSLSRTSLSFQNNSQSSSLMAEGAIFIFNESSFSSDIINVGI